MEKSLSKKRSIVTNNLDESKFYVYSNTGILRNRIDYNKLTEYYGQIDTVSPDGSKYLLKKDRNESAPLIQIFELTEKHFMPMFTDKMDLNKTII